ncbi:hypothetical protein RsTz2092_01570 [Deferribacterales bacterium RsTz2092]|nr:hypothetical protein AGMMS49941_00020 [Deferribacterales bacterium]
MKNVLTYLRGLIGLLSLLATLSLLLAIPCGQVLAQEQEQSNYSFPRNTSPYIASLVKPNYKYTWQDYAKMSIWASQTGGRTINEQEILAYTATIENAVHELLPALPQNDQKTQAEFILRYIHNKFLKTYEPKQTRLDVLLATGTYNCVSSANLYMLLTQAAGIQTVGVITKDHAFISVLAGGQAIDVETTNRYGFDPGSKKEFKDEFGSSTGFAYVPQGNYHDRRDISPLELISLIMSNRLADANQGSHDEVIPLAIDRATLLKGRANPISSPLFIDADNDAAVRVYNYGVFLLNSGRERAAIAWTEQATKLYPDYPPYKKLLDTAKHNIGVEYHNKFVKLYNSRDFLAAKQVVQEGLTEVPQDEQLLKDIELLQDK